LEIPADIIVVARPDRCDGHHPVTVMERDSTFSRETGVFGATLGSNLAEAMGRC